VLAGTTGEGAALDCVSLVGVGPATAVVAGITRGSTDLASVRFIGLGPSSHCGGGHES
jgi:hypothetical protein